MNNLQKFINRLNQKERKKFDQTIESILTNNLEHLDIKKIKGYESHYRVRLGRIRIVFIKHKPAINEVIYSGFRDDTTYNL